MNETSAAPGKHWYVIAGLIAFAALAAAAALVVWFVFHLDRGTQFLAPGRHVAQLDKPGKYLVWNDYRTQFEGRSHHFSERLPSGVVVLVRDAASGKALDVSPSHGTRVSFGGTKRSSVAAFEIVTPGRYEIVIEGDFPRRVFSTSQDFVWRLFLVIFGALAILIGGCGLAIAIVCWVVIRSNAAREKQVGAGAGGGA